MNAQQYAAKAKIIIKQRREKLEKIKPLVPLKTYNLLEEKIENEERAFSSHLRQKETEDFKTEAEKSQALPKAFFEQKFLNTKTIRID